MSPVPFALEFVCVFFVTLIILHQYGDLRKQHVLVTLAVFISWFFSFLIVFILPLDVSNSCYLECLKRSNSTNMLKNIYPLSRTDFAKQRDEKPICFVPWSYVSGDLLPYLWRVIYWSSQLLSWIILPMMQSYVYAGSFTVWGKIKTALYENAIWYGSYLVIFGALLIYVALKPELAINSDSLKLIGITASNTWGLLLLVLLLGYGLVELPRTSWNMSRSDLRLEHTYFKVSKLSTSKEDADEELADTLSLVKKASEEIKYNSNLRKHLDVIIKKCPESSVALFCKGNDDFLDYKAGTLEFNEKALVNLHKKVMVITQRAHRTHVQWNALLKLAFYLEDVERNKSSSDKKFKLSFSEYTQKSILAMRLLWFWEIIIKPWMFRVLSLLLLILSICLVWSESTFFMTEPVLSIFTHLINITKQNYLYFQIEVVSCVTIAYMCICTYYTVFKIKIFNFYYFEPHHETDANSLLFSGLLFCRLTYAICLNFLAMIHMDGHVTGRSGTEISETYFTQFMGHMDLLSFIAKGFNLYYPIIVLLVCVCTFFSIGNRLLHCLGIQQFLSDDDFSADFVREGKEIVRREKRKIERQINGKNWSARSKTVSDRYVGEKSLEHNENNSDDSILETSNLSSKTRLNVNKPMLYSKLNHSEDKINLMSDIEYAPPDTNDRVVKGYQNIKGVSLSNVHSSVLSRSSVPRNIFDDA
ncbi:G-protein coupled receptor-associated protein LMBRD2 [Hydra vulgaris]|uniref:G-protein coupled receptor-associated protein LMBRD2 n=1 Tax=Hydra vulgaris TaxID=6087 RepID=A0ABM4CMS0_HYDVU